MWLIKLTMHVCFKNWSFFALERLTEERKISNIQTKGLIFSAQKITKAILIGNLDKWEQASSWKDLMWNFCEDN